MKKRLLIAAVLLFSLVLGLGVGVFAFSGDNLKNASKGYKHLAFTESSGLVMKNWAGSNGAYVSGDDPQIIIENIGEYVHNVRLDIAADSELTSVEVFYTDNAGEEFTVHKYFIAPVEKKNDDYYLTIDRSVQSLRFDIYTGTGRSLSIDKIDLNPTKLNFNTLPLVLLTLLPFLIGYSLIEILYDKKMFAKDVLAMKRYKYLLYDLVTKDIKTKYRRSVLGILWSVLNPLLMMLVLTAVFSNIIRVEVEGGFALFYLTGYIIFNFISESTGFSLYTITSAAPLIKKVYIPKYVFPLEKCIFSFVNMLFSLIAFVIVFIFFCITGDIAPHFSMLLFPLPMIYVFLFSLGLCFILSALMVFFRDIGHIWGILLTVWMYASPIIYPIEMVPSWLGSIIRLNPLYHYIDYFRNVMIYGRIPGLVENGICLLYSIAFLLIGVVVFRKSQDKFVLHI